MIQIRQHGDNEELFDMNLFKGDIEKFYAINEWEIQIEWCLGEKAQDIEQISTQPMRIKNQEFWRLYIGIHQTVDGSFSGLTNGVESCKLQAVDSSFWNISGSMEFEEHMQLTYGLYVKPNA
jgi:hypothetical protein